jgi:putative thiazole-containing bacteriocin maturation protein
MLTQSTRPKCKADTYYVPLPDGVYLRGNNNRLVLKGKSLYPLLERLIPNLNGNVTLEELTGGLDAERKRMVVNLIEKLFAHQFLQDASQDQHHTLRPLELETYASDIAFIESFQTSAAYRFEHFRDKRLLFIAARTGLASLARLGLQCGLRHVNTLLAEEEEAAVSSYQAAFDALTREYSEQKTTLLEAPDWDNEDEVRSAIQGYDAVLHIAEQRTLGRAQMLNRLCLEKQKPCIQAVIIDDQAWLGPLVTPENGNCWECAWRRLQANMAATSQESEHYALRDRAQDAGSLSPSSASMIANRLLFGLFQYFTQTSSLEENGKLTALDLTTYLSESHTFLAHPQCQAHQRPAAVEASQFLERITQLQQRYTDSPDAFVQKIAACIDEKLGLFTALDTDNFVQVPLAVYRARLSNPMLEPLACEPYNVYAVSTDTRTALTRAGQKACERYAATLLDTRRLLSSERVQQSSLDVVPGEQLLGGEPFAPARDWWSWALDLRAQQAALVPASHVFSSLNQAARGIGSGQTWEEALCQALLDRCNELTVAQLQHAQQPYARVDCAAIALTSEGKHLARLLKLTGRQVTAYDITSALRIPTFAICLDGRAVAYSSHCDQAEALRQGLELAMQQCQSEQFQQADYALAPVVEFPKHLRGETLSAPDYTLPRAWPERLAWLLEQLQSNGLRAYAVPLDHDPALAPVLPFIVRVLLGKRELERGA